jgi:hypothetical protein
MRTVSFALLIAFATALLAPAQSKPAGAGHWEGAIQVPDHELKIVVDLAQNAKGDWIGTIGIPDQGTKDFALSKVSVKGASVSFVMSGVPGDPSFEGQLSTSGKEITGNFSQGGALLTFELKWVSEPSVKEPAKSTAIAKEFEGNWEGTLALPNGSALRLLLKLANGAGGATGTLVSIDQGGVELPASTITQKGAAITVEVSAVGGKFDGELKKGELAGTWTQGPGPLPLTLKRTTQ